MKLSRAVALLVVVPMALPACGHRESSSGASVTPGVARQEVVSMIRSRNSGDARVTWYRSLSDLLPNVEYAEPNQPVTHVTDYAVLGRVLSVTKGYGFDDSPGDGNISRRVSFDSSNADWKTIHLRLQAVELLPAGAKPVLDVGIAVNANEDFAVLQKAYTSMDRAVWFLHAGSPVFAYDSKLLSVLEDGALIATVGQGERLSLPFLDEDRAVRLLSGAPTLSSLRDASTSTRKVELENRGGVVFRRTEP